jgi:hypothetical protein
MSMSRVRRDGPNPRWTVVVRRVTNGQSADVGDRRSSAADALKGLRRSWWFCGLEGLRPVRGYVTYDEFDLDDQPDVGRPDESLSWLETQPEHARWNIYDSDAMPQRRVTTAALAELVPSQIALPAALTEFAARPELQRRIRSATGCYLDLGDFLARTAHEGGHLLHLVSDQQWIRHWLVYLDDVGNESVVTTTEPVGFELPEDEEWEPLPPEAIPLDSSFDLQVCADSVAEFLFRFWVENELYFSKGSRKSPAEAKAYAAELAILRDPNRRRGRQRPATDDS